MRSALEPAAEWPTPGHGCLVIPTTLPGWVLPTLLGLLCQRGLLSGDRVARAPDDAVARCDLASGTLCLLVNLDNLQAVNDGDGHRQADPLIAETAQRLRQLAGGRGCGDRPAA